MIRMYGTQRSRNDAAGRRISAIQLGAIYRIQDRVNPLYGIRAGRHVDTWQVIGFTPRRFAKFTGGYPAFRTVSIYGEGQVVVKSLRSGKLLRVGYWFMQAHDDAGMEVVPL